MSKGHHPESNDTSKCAEEDYAKDISKIWRCVWITELGRIDIAYAISAMRRFKMLPREGHLKASVSDF
jgi:hypothetical protein